MGARQTRSRKDAPGRLVSDADAGSFRRAAIASTGARPTIYRKDVTDRLTSDADADSRRRAAITDTTRSARQTSYRREDADDFRRAAAAIAATGSARQSSCSSDAEFDKLVRNADDFRRLAIAEAGALRFEDAPEYALDWKGRVLPYLEEVRSQSVEAAQVMREVLRNVTYITTRELLTHIDRFVDVLNDAGAPTCIVLPMGADARKKAAPDSSNVWLALVAASRLRFQYVADPSCDLPLMEKLAAACPDVEFLLFDDVLYSGRQTTERIVRLRNSGIHNAYAVVAYVHHREQIDAVVHPKLQRLAKTASQPLRLLTEVADLKSDDKIAKGYFEDGDRPGERDLLTLTYCQFKHPDSWSMPRGLLSASVYLPNVHVEPRWLIKNCSDATDDHYDDKCPPGIYKPKLRTLAETQQLRAPCAETLPLEERRVRK